MTLQERIARMGLDKDPSQAPSTPTTQRATGAAGRIGDKISKFQQKAEDSPLLPSGGSFGLAGSRRAPSSSATTGSPRVASLGLGRAAVPLDVVKMRRTASAGGSTPSSSDMAQAGSDQGAGSGATTPSSSRASSTHGASATVEVSQSTSGAPHAASGFAAGSMTPSARSVSSMDVEEGSYTSEAGPDPNSISLSHEQMVPSPLSSPVLTALVDPIVSIDDSEPLSPTTLSAPPKGPLSALKAPLRSPSSVSVSSMVVEVGDDGPDASGSIPSGVSTPTAEDPAPIPRVIGEADEEEMEGSVGNDDEKLETMNAELQQYEAETVDVTAPPTNEESTAASPEPSAFSPELSRPVLSTYSIGSIPRNLSQMASETQQNDTEGDSAMSAPAQKSLSARPTADEDSTPPASPAMPEVKCSDCGASVKFSELVEHTCARVEQPAADSSAVATSPTAEPETAPPAANASASPVSQPASPAISTGQGMERSTSQRSSSKIHSFVPQTESLVPEDVLDMYGDDDEDDAAVEPSSDARGTSALPVDVDEEEHDVDNAVRSPRSADVPQDEFEPDLDDVIAPAQSRLSSSDGRKSSSPRSPSVYDRVGASVYDDEDEHAYSGGTAVVTRITASHGSGSGSGSASMSRSGSLQK